MSIVHNEEQVKAIEGIVDFVENSTTSSFVVLEAAAGCGKTTCIKEILKQLNYGSAATVTAPTNKAVKVIRESVGDSVSTETIFRFLGLRLLANGEVKTLSSSSANIYNLDRQRLVVIDEGSMVGRELVTHVSRAAEINPQIKWVILGDRWQLPPVRETISGIWAIPNRFELHKVMRNDSAILRTATHVREILQTGKGSLALKEDNDGTSGVWLPKQGILNSIIEHSEEMRDGSAKAIAWRNDTVDFMNSEIRKSLFKDHNKSRFLVGERVTVTEPVMCLFESNKILANTDDEGIVISVNVEQHPFHRRFLAYRVIMETEDCNEVTLFTPHESSAKAVEAYKQELASAARKESRQWKAFWSFHESWSAIRHGYAITSHRSQGSTYQKAFVDWRDILVNRKRDEALRCLYVAVSRPKVDLYLG